MPAPACRSLSQGSRFALSGVFATALHIATASLLINAFQASQTAANGTAYVCATVFSYFINTLWSFTSTISANTLLRFLTVSGGSFAITLGISALAQQQGLDYRLGIAAVVCTVPLVTFLLHRAWTYRT